MHIGNCASFTLEVNPHGRTTRHSDDHLSKRSAEECPGCYRGELLQFPRSEAAYDAGKNARGGPSEHSSAHHQSPRARALGFLYLFCREARAGVRGRGAFLSQKFAFETAHQAISKIVRAQNSLSGDLARLSFCPGVAVSYNRGKNRGVSDPNDYHEVH